MGFAPFQGAPWADISARVVLLGYWRSGATAAIRAVAIRGRSAEASARAAAACAFCADWFEVQPAAVMAKTATPVARLATMPMK